MAADRSVVGNSAARDPRKAARAFSIRATATRTSVFAAKASWIKLSSTGSSYSFHQSSCGATAATAGVCAVPINGACAAGGAEGAT